MTATIEGGRKGRAAGASSEGLVLAQGERYYVQGLARLERVGTPMAGWGRFMRPTQGAGCDFRGVLAGGRAIVLEVKSTSAASLPLREGKGSTIRPGQAVQLSWASALGAWAVVVVRIRARWWVVEWPAWLEAVAFAEEAGRASLSPEMLSEAGTEVSVDDGRPMWMEGLK